MQKFDWRCFLCQKEIIITTETTIITAITIEIIITTIIKIITITEIITTITTANSCV